MLDPILSLTFNLHSSPGTYALLLGSGLSRSAGIPTGWEITLDLIKKLSHLDKEDYSSDPVAWYRGKFKQEPDYSQLLEALSSSPAAQQQILRSYFEPNNEEKEEGKKLPTKAHQAIAELVHEGFIKIIITTNFDRLMESALEQTGVAPTIISSPDAAIGAPPLVHNRCTIIKLHGDYLDTRIKNSSNALASYDSNINKLLDQIFDEYGLIVCGWSAEYDTALCAALNRTRSRRYPMFWTSPSKPDGTAKKLIDFHKAIHLYIKGADEFFVDLCEKFNALTEFARPHPLSTHAAVASLKFYLPDPKHRIRLRDLVIGEAVRTKDDIIKFWKEFKIPPADSETFLKCLTALEAVTERLCALFVHGSFFGDEQNSRIWKDAFQLIDGLNHTDVPSNVIWGNVLKYPALLLIYSAGIGATGGDHYSILSSLAMETSVFEWGEQKFIPAPLKYNGSSIISSRDANKLLGLEKKTPLSHHLMEVLQPSVYELIPELFSIEKAFDRFEYLWSLQHVDHQLQIEPDYTSMPYGSYIWRSTKILQSYPKYNCEEEIKKIIESGKADWGPLKAGFFGGKIERLKKAHEEGRKLLLEIAPYLRF